MRKTITTILAAAAQRGLPCLLIGGHAIGLLGHYRSTTDVDFLIPSSSLSAWLDLMRELQYRFFHGSHAFVQLEPGQPDLAPVDLMIVTPETWSRLSMDPIERDVDGIVVRLPRPEHMLALKLHSASSPDRGKPEVDWEDIRQIVDIWKIDPANPQIRELFVRYGGESALRRLESFKQ